jgi:hypothetical protein
MDTSNASTGYIKQLLVCLDVLRVPKVAIPTGVCPQRGAPTKKDAATRLLSDGCCPRCVLRFLQVRHYPVYALANEV